MDLATQECNFAAMGTTCHVLVVGGPIGLADATATRVHELEQLWSRFLPHSEISILNRDGGTQKVSPETALLVSLAIDGSQQTAGRFDPTILAALTSAGYDRTFEQLATTARACVTNPKPAPGCASIGVDTAAGTVTLPVGVGFDPGGIGKGLAADLVSEEAMAAGAVGVLVNLGGDLRARGVAPSPAGWGIAVRQPSLTAEPLAVVSFGQGALATSTTAKRQWRRAGRCQHHLIDPHTGRPTNGAVAFASVIAGEAWWAEVLTKQLFMCTSVDHAVNVLHGAPALLVLADGSQHYVGGFGDFIQTPEKAAS